MIVTMKSSLHEASADNSLNEGRDYMDQEKKKTALDIQRKLKKLHNAANENDMNLLAYLIEVAMLEAAERTQ